MSCACGSREVCSCAGPVEESKPAANSAANWPSVTDQFKNVRRANLDNGTYYYEVDNLSIMQKNSKTLKFSEDEYVKEVNEYINNTYKEHYGQGEIQTFELIASSGNADGFTMGSIQKYSSRYGKKQGFNRKDILKIIHYGILALWYHDKMGRK